MKKLYLGIYFVTSCTMYAYQISFQDFMNALDKYKATKDISTKATILNIYEMLPTQDQLRAQQELQKTKIKLTNELSDQDKQQLWNNFSEHYTNWYDRINSQNWNATNWAEFRNKTADIFNKLIDAYRRLDDSQKPHAVSFIQASLHQFPTGSIQFQFTDSMLADFHINRTEEARASMQTMLNHQKDLNEKIKAFSGEEANYKKLLVKNKYLKEEIPNLQNELTALTQKLALSEQPESTQTVEQENKELTQQLLTLRKEVADLEQQLKKKAQKRKQ